ncbi:MAG: RNA-binding protein [Hyphomicrobiaceae bacterium]|nr:RNA-binding protein [Hyphomicrobiaceae bacterium]
MVVRIGSAGEPAAERHASLRTCIVTREQRPPEELIRFVPGPGAEIVPDVARRLPGRGVWVSAERGAVAEAVRRKAFARSLKRQVVARPDLPEVVERLLAKRAGDALSLANKAGLVTTGFTRVEAAIAAGGVAALLHGQDAAEDGVAKLDRLFRAVSAQTGRPAVVDRELTVEQLSLALGRANVVHAALSAGGATTNFLNEAGRVARYRSGSPPSEGRSAAS